MCVVVLNTLSQKQWRHLFSLVQVFVLYLNTHQAVEWFPELFHVFGFQLSELLQLCYRGAVMAMGDMAKRRHVCGKWAGRQAVTYHYSAPDSPWVTWGEWKVRRRESEKSKEDETGVEQTVYNSPHTITHNRPLATPNLGNLLFVFLLIVPTAAGKPTWQYFTTSRRKKNPKWKDTKVKSDGFKTPA